MCNGLAAGGAVYADPNSSWLGKYLCGKLCPQGVWLLYGAIVLIVLVPIALLCECMLIALLCECMLIALLCDCMLIALLCECMLIALL